MITVITTLYKGNVYLKNLLNMIERNTIYLHKWNDIPVEYIVVNDFPDEELQYDERNYSFTLRIFVPKKNQGIHGARIIGLNQTKGDYILFLDQDDVISDRYLRSQHMHIHDKDICICNCVDYQKRNASVLYKSKNIQNVILRSKWFYTLFYDPILSMGQVLIRKSAIPEAWNQNVMKINCCDDYYLWLLMFYNHAKLTINNNIIFKHSYTGNNVSFDEMNMIRSENEMIKCLKKSNSINFMDSIILRRRVNFEYLLCKNKTELSNIQLLKNLDMYIIHLVKMKLFEYLKGV